MGVVVGLDVRVHVVKNSKAFPLYHDGPCDMPDQDLQSAA
jgi:hypothetical protein